MSEPLDHPEGYQGQSDRARKPEEKQTGTDSAKGFSSQASSMMLLQTILDSALDPGYRAAAERPPKKLRWWRTLLIAILVLLLGLGTGISIRALRMQSEVSSQTRGFLLEQVLAKQLEADTLKEDIARLELNAYSLQNATPNVAPLPSFVRVAVGRGSVQGAGVSVKMEDQPGSRDADGNVKDAHIRAVVNLLWQAGAEAIAINDVRLGPDTTIRTAGSAILVDLEPVSSPYQILAVGNPEALMSTLTVGDSGAAVAAFAERAGFRFAVTEEDSIFLPAAAQGRLKYARILEEKG